MSKYEPLWKYIQNDSRETITLSFDEIGQIAGVAIDHLFLNYKKELLEYGYKVGKISLKMKTVVFDKLKNGENGA